jgi:hypothetical protein
MCSGCAAAKSPGTREPVATIGQMTYVGALPSGPEGRLQLYALPRGGSYRWADAARHFTGAAQVGDSVTDSDARADVSQILRLHGWREVADGEQPQFELAVGRYERIVHWLAQAPGERIQVARDPRACERLPRAERDRCLDPVVNGSAVRMRSTETRYAFAIVRIEDQATAWWIAPDQKVIQRYTLEMIQRGIEGETAFGH